MAFAHFALDCSVCVRVNTDRIAAELANACADRKATG
jgi:hypothetical protein